MTEPLTPQSVSELAEAVRSAPRVLAVGAGTKPRLAVAEAVRISTARLSGITEYEPSEFTFTALAGTSIRDIASTLAESGQYLPFDPYCVQAGATLGGTVAAGLSGPGRFRFGGFVDFILGVRFVDGAGRLLRMGGKVVKNAAGFDLPKFFVGSLGRFGVLAEITFKVFPRPAETLTTKLPVSDAAVGAEIVVGSANTRWEPDAIDWLPGGEAICIRLAGPPQALEEISREVFTRWPGEVLTAAQANEVWSELREFRWAAADAILIKVALTPAQLTAFSEIVRALACRAHISTGGNVAFVALASSAQATNLDESLCRLGLAAMTLRGDAPLWLGTQKRPKIVQAVKDALDPQHRFPALDD